MRELSPSTANPSVPYLQVAQLGIERGDHCLINNLDFSADGGQLIHISGPNGSGKTSLMRALAGVLYPSHGNIYCHGEEIRYHPNYRHELQYVAHRPGLSEHLSAIENLEFLAAVSETPTKSSALEALRYFHSDRFLDLPVRSLSAGQKQRAALARLHMFDTKMWILDEPFTALDQNSRNRLEQSIDDQVANGGVVVIATHQGFNSSHQPVLVNLESL